jgi:hypothetical protein
MHVVQPVTPQPTTTTVIIVATSDADFDNPPAGTIIVAPGYTPED